MIAARDPSSAFNSLLRKLQQHVPLSAAEQDALLSAFSSSYRVAKGDLIAQESRAGETLSVLLHGLALSSRSLLHGQSQTLALHLPGDLMDANAFVLGVERATVVAHMPCVVATISHRQLTTLITASPNIGLALWGQMTADAAIAQEWLLGLGQRSALQNAAHFICEVQARYRAAGLPADGAFAFPFTQETLGQILGLSAVHVNRVMKQLRRDRLVQVSRSTVKLLDPDALAALAGFDPIYLEPLPSAFLRIMAPPRARPAPLHAGDAQMSA